MLILNTTHDVLLARLPEGPTERNKTPKLSIISKEAIDVLNAVQGPTDVWNITQNLIIIPNDVLNTVLRAVLAIISIIGYNSFNYYAR